MKFSPQTKVGNREQHFFHFPETNLSLTQAPRKCNRTSRDLVYPAPVLLWCSGFCWGAWCPSHMIPSGPESLLLPFLSWSRDFEKAETPWKGPASLNIPHSHIWGLSAGWGPARIYQPLPPSPLLGVSHFSFCLFLFLLIYKGNLLPPTPSLSLHPIPDISHNRKEDFILSSVYFLPRGNDSKGPVSHPLRGISTYSKENTN